MFDFLEKHFMTPLSKLSGLKFVQAITQAGMSSIAFSVVGSLFLVLSILPSVFTPLQGLYDVSLGKVTDIYMLAFNASIDILALYFLLVIGYEYTKLIANEKDLNLSPIAGMLLCLFGFVMVVPIFTNVDGLHKLTDVDSGILNGWAIGGAPSRFGGQGVFQAIIISWMCVNIYRWCVEKNIVIKLPDSVPDGVANSFTALIPTFFVALIIMVINGILVYFGTDLFQLIQKPFGFITSIANSWIGAVICVLLIHALWLVGIHGSSIIQSLLGPVGSYNLVENLNGAHEYMSGDIFNSYILIGGAGATLGLVILMTFLAKSDQYKILGKSAIVPGIFQINEPIIFGLPIVYNPIFAIPFVLAPIANATISYFAVTSGIVTPNIATYPWPTPVGLGAFIGTAGDWKAAVLALICLVISTLIYLPFFKFSDNKLYKEQLELENETSQEE